MTMGKMFPGQPVNPLDGFPSKPQALIIALIGLAAVSHAVIFIRLADPMPALALAAFRVGIATLVFLPIAAWGFRHAPRSWPSRKAILACCLSGIFLAAHFAAWIESVQRLTIAESALLVSLAPVWIAIANIVLGNGVPSRGVVFGMALCVLGMTVIGWDSLATPSGDPVGLALAIVGGMAVAGYLMIGRQVRQDLSTTVYVTLCYGVAAICLSLLGVALAMDLSGLPLEVWAGAIALGLISQVVGHTAYNLTLARLSPIFVAICLLGEPIVGGVLGLLYLGESIPTATLIGGIPILFGLWLSIRAEL